jgi:hypothetical protein
MIIEFRKIPVAKTSFDFKIDSVAIAGNFYKINNRLVDIKANMSGKISVVCNRCAKEFDIDIDEEVELKVSDGIYPQNNNELDELIYETFDANINFDDIFGSEIEAMKMDYHFCSECSEEEYEKEF